MNNRNRRKRARKEGKCCVCLKRKVKSQRTRCRHCIKQQAEYQKKYRQRLREAGYQ